MSIAELKAEIDRLPPEEKQEIRNYLRTKMTPLSEQQLQSLAAKIDDNNPANWMTLEEARKVWFPDEQA